jgi:hypothetical protein
MTLAHKQKDVALEKKMTRQLESLLHATETPALFEGVRKLGGRGWYTEALKLYQEISLRRFISGCDLPLRDPQLEKTIKDNLDILYSTMLKRTELLGFTLSRLGGSVLDEDHIAFYQRIHKPTVGGLELSVQALSRYQENLLTMKFSGGYPADCDGLLQQLPPTELGLYQQLFTPEVIKSLTDNFSAN